MTEQTSFTIPGLTIAAPSLAVNWGTSGTPAVEVITSLVLTQQIQLRNTNGNPATRGYSSFTWTWTPTIATSVLADAMADAGWDTALPTLDPTQVYSLSITQAGI